MLIDFNTTIKTLDGITMTIDGKEMSIREIVANTLSLAKPKKQTDSIRQLDLALKIYNSKESIDLEQQDVDIIKVAVEEANFSTLVGGQILKLLVK